MKDFLVNLENLKKRIWTSEINTGLTPWDQMLPVLYREGSQPGHE
jgi:hypothetical protein